MQEGCGIPSSVRWPGFTQAFCSIRLDPQLQRVPATLPRCATRPDGHFRSIGCPRPGWSDSFLGNGSALRPTARQDGVCRDLPSRQAGRFATRRLRQQLSRFRVGVRRLQVAAPTGPTSGRLACASVAKPGSRPRRTVLRRVCSRTTCRPGCPDSHRHLPRSLHAH